MAVRNKFQHIVTISGSSNPPGSLRPGPTESGPPPEPTIPDIVFSDTSLPVFSKQYTVYGSWNIPVSGFSIGDLVISWPDPLNPDGTVSLTFSDGSASSSIHFNFYDNRRGSVTVTVLYNAVISYIDNRTLGPVGERSFLVEFDTYPQDIELDINLPNPGPATLKLNKPLTTTWTQNIWRQTFTWSKPVSGFTGEDDQVTVTATGTGTQSVAKSPLVKDSEDNKVYYMDLALAGEGAVTVHVNAEIAKAGGAQEANSPVNAVTESWNFDVTPGSLTIAGVTEICSESYPITDHAWLESGTDGGSFLGVSDMIVANNRVYFTCQIQKKRAGRNEVSVLNPSAGAFASVPIDGMACTIHKKYDNFMYAARSSVEHNEDVYFFEGCGYVYFNPPRNEDNFNNRYFNLMGIIQKIDSSGEIESLGLNWATEFHESYARRYDGSHVITFSPMISQGDNLHLISQKKNFDDIEGEQWIVYGKNLNQRLPVFETNEKTGFQILEELAQLSNCIIQTNKNIFVFRPRNAPQAYLNSDITASSTSIAYKNLNIVLGLSQIIKIDDELISFSSINATTISQLTRGAYGTTADSHSENASIIFVNHIIDATDTSHPIHEIRIDTDGSQIYNNIITKYAQNEIPRSDFLILRTVDNDSITSHGEGKFELELPFDIHQNKWAIQVSREFINRFKDEQVMIQINLKRNFDIDLGHVLYVSEPRISNQRFVCQVMEISHDREAEETNITAVTIEPLPFDSYFPT